jgi:nitronate monooxygenase
MIWPSQRLLDLLGIDLPIIQAPMAGLATSAMAAAVAEAGGLGSMGCAVLSADQIRAELSAIRRQTAKPINLNFFCHASPATDPAREAAWRGQLKSYYVELGLDPEMRLSTLTVDPFGSAHCDLVAELKPEVVSFHFGLPNRDLLARVKGVGAKILSSATCVKEAIWLEQRGCDAIIAQVADAVRVPVIAAGGIADERGIAAAFMLGASGVQMGTAYLFCPEANVSPLHRQVLKTAQDDQTVLTNVLSGRAARAIVNRIVRELGPMSEHAPAFPLAGAALAPLRSGSEPSGSDDFTPLWSGQAARLGRELPAGELTVRLAKRALAKLGALQRAPS